MKYRNRKNEWVSVSEEHLQTALKIKQELQKASPSLRCPWGKHKSLMAKAGFDDSESTESYRQMIKRYQYSSGEIEEIEKEAVDSIGNPVISEIGEMAFQKREVQIESRNLNKVKRQLMDEISFRSEVKSAIKEALDSLDLKSLVRSIHSPSPVIIPSGSRLIAVVSDWHIGALVKVDSNEYNFEIANQRINTYVQKIIRLGLNHNVEHIDVVYMGDMLEHAYMRNSQAYHAEFPVSKQMTLGGRLIIEMLVKLAQSFNVTYRGFSGNHDRINGDKNGNIDGDTGMVVVNEMVRLFVETSHIENIEYVSTKDFSAVLESNGKMFKFVHGDLEKKADTRKIHDHSSRDRTVYDAIVYGHFHHHMVLEVGVDRLEIRCGSIKGSDDYSEKLGLGSAPSQLGIIVTKDGEILPQRIRV